MSTVLFYIGTLLYPILWDIAICQLLLNFYWHPLELDFLRFYGHTCIRCVSRCNLISSDCGRDWFHCRNLLMPCIMMQCQLSCRWIVVPAFNVQPKSGLSGDHVGHLAICVETLLHWHIFHTIHDWDYHLCWNTLCGNVTMWYPIYCWVTYLQGSLKPTGKPETQRFQKSTHK